MRERAAATIFMWIALAASIDRILASLTYTQMMANPGSPGDIMPQTMLVSQDWQLGAAILIFVLILAAGGATVAIWQGGAQKADQEANRLSEKAKRDNRDARIKRLLATMDDEQLDALEQDRLSDGERTSLETLLRKGD